MAEGVWSSGIEVTLPTVSNKQFSATAALFNACLPSDSHAVRRPPANPMHPTPFSGRLIPTQTEGTAASSPGGWISGSVARSWGALATC